MQWKLHLRPQRRPHFCPLRKRYFYFYCIAAERGVMRPALEGPGFPAGRNGKTGRGLPSIKVASLSHSPDQTVEDVASVLADALSLGKDVAADLSRETLLFGSLPELDSMAVATVLTALEDRFGILIDDDEVTGELFESVGSLADFVSAKRAAA